MFLLAAMGATLLMALAVSDAFGDGSRRFGIAYFVVRILAAGFYWIASKTFPEQRAAFFTFFPLSFAAALLVQIGGFLDAPWLGILWVAGVLLSIAAVAFRATRYVATDRILATVALTLLAWLGGSLTAEVFTTIVAAILVLVTVCEHFHPWAPQAAATGEAATRPT